MSAIPRLPALDVASASFFRVECSHEQLFHAEYKRSNRNKGLKILRCFPHCCPEHIDRSYCGASLSLRVTLQDKPPDKSTPATSPPSEVMAVFARFEAVSDVSLEPGEFVDAVRIAAGMQSAKNLGGQWLVGTLDGPSSLVTTIHPPGMPSDDQKPLVYHLNGKPLSRWYYDWESGANKAQRLTKHVLKAYIVERCAIDKDGNFTVFTGRNAHTQLYRVLHVVKSPEFTVVSYRRAVSEQYQTVELEDRHALVEASSQHFYAVKNADGEYSQNFRVNNSQHQYSVSGKQEPPHHKESWNENLSAPLADSVFSAEVEDKLRWEFTNSATVAVSRDLALLVSFLHWAPLSAYGPLVDDVVHLTCQNLSEAFTGDVSKTNGFTKFIVDQAITTGLSTPLADGESPIVGGNVDLPHKIECLLRVLAQAARWFYSADQCQWVNAFFRQNAGSALHKNAMRACFVQFVHEIQSRLDQEVFAFSELRTVANAAEEVIASVYSYPYFHARRQQVRQMLSGQNFIGWNAFVAQIREMYIGLSSSPSEQRELTVNYRGLTFDRAYPPRSSIEDDWNGEWILEVNEAAWEFNAQNLTNEEGDPSSRSRIDNAGCVVSVPDMFALISQIIRLQVAIDTQACTLRVRSTQGVAGALGGTRVVLDGKERTFSQFPNGMATAVDPGAHGNYVGEMQVEEPERLVVYLDIYSWGSGPSYNIRTRIECLRSHCLSVSGDVLVTSAPSSFTSEQILSLDEMSLREKREAVNNMHTSHLREPTAREDFTAPAVWKELGRFRLAYLKL